MTRVDFFWFTAGPGYAPDRLFDAGRIAGGIGILTGGIFFAATRVKNDVAVFGKSEVAEFLAVVGIVRSDLARGELRSFGHPNVALALLIEGPGDTVGLFRRGEIGGKWCAENLLECEGARGLRGEVCAPQEHAAHQYRYVAYVSSHAFLRPTE